MRIWLALIVAPVLTLVNQSISFGMVGSACAAQNVVAMHVVHLAFLATAVTFAAMAWQQSRAIAADPREPDRRLRRHFLARLATASAALSSLTIAAMWIPTWMISACIA